MPPYKRYGVFTSAGYPLIHQSIGIELPFFFTIGEKTIVISAHCRPHGQLIQAVNEAAQTRSFASRYSIQGRNLAPVELMCQSQ